LDGHGISANYGRLREACQTSVDGTSIDALEEVAKDLGLEADQIMVPAVHVPRADGGCLPCIAVTVLPSSGAHFVVVWRRVGPWLLVMDPSSGRRWVSVEQLDRELFRHSMRVPRETWSEWFASDETQRVLRGRMRDVGLSSASARTLLDDAVAREGWRATAALEAALRLVAKLVDGKAVARGRDAGALLSRLAEHAREAEDPLSLLPSTFWTVDPSAPLDADEVDVRGAVLLRIHGVRPVGADDGQEALSPELRAVVNQPTGHPLSRVLGMLRNDGLFGPLALLLAIGGAAIGVVVQALLLRSLLDFGSLLGAGYRVGLAVAIVAGLTGLLAILERPKWSLAFDLARRLDLRLRMALLHKIPRLRDAYFTSRLKSDMAERAHAIHQLRRVPLLGVQLLESAAALVFTVVGIGLLDPMMFPLTAAVGLVALLLPLGSYPLLVERDLRLRTHTAALMTYHLDALLGLTAIRTHRAEPALRRRHEGLLVDWVDAGMRLQKVAVLVEGLLSLAGFAMAAVLLAAHLGRTEHPGSALLLVYWALQIPVLGRSVATAARQYPSLRSVALRLTEPLDAPVAEGVDRSLPSDHQSEHAGVEISLQGVDVERAGHLVLQGLDLRIQPGEHVAIVGASGAGKSTLAGLLLGWHDPARGELLVNGESLDPQRLANLRRGTAWVDPAVTLWNRSLIENLRFGTEGASVPIRLSLLDAAALTEVVERLPQGLQAPLGEGGGSLSGGETQRVRLGRAMLRESVRLVVLDEPFRGLDREARRELLTECCQHWPNATLLFISHDVGDTIGFDRVVVMADGRVAEQGAPLALADDAGSSYRALLDAERRVHEAGWHDGRWRRWRMVAGKVEEIS